MYLYPTNNAMEVVYHYIAQITLSSQNVC